MRTAGARIGSTISGIVVALVVAAAPAWAQDAPPGWVDQGAGAWVAFTVNPTSPLLVAGSRSDTEPIELTRVGNLTSAQLAGALAWDPTDHDGDPLTVDRGWPAEFNVGTVRLVRTDPWCDYLAPSCHYRVVDAGDFWVGAGQPLDSAGNADPSQFPALASITLPAAPQLHVGFNPNLNPVPAQGGTAGKITLDASGFTHDDLAGTTLTYEWFVKNLTTSKVFSATGETTDLTLDQDGDYCIQLKVTASDGLPPVQTPDCGGVAPTFRATGFAPAAAAPPAPPAAAPEPDSSAGGASSAGGGGIVFANPVPRSFAGAGTVSAPSVVWLWRPDWFASTAEPRSKPEPINRPDLSGRREIVVDTNMAAGGASATPWLAGVGLFGLLGGGWLFRRRRMLHHLPLELPLEL